MSMWQAMAPAPTSAKERSADTGQRVAKLVDGRVVALHLGGAQFDSERSGAPPDALSAPGRRSHQVEEGARGDNRDPLILAKRQ
jgi:hypothetical protein